jgi:hypothetical protein
MEMVTLLTFPWRVISFGEDRGYRAILWLSRYITTQAGACDSMRGRKKKAHPRHERMMKKSRMVKDFIV